MIPWFRDFYKVMQQANVDFRWTAIGVVDNDIASARSVLEWGEELLDSVDYVIVHNHYQEGVASAWENPKVERDVKVFREMFSPFEIRMDARRPDLQRMMRTMNVTLADVGDRNTDVPELTSAGYDASGEDLSVPRVQPIHGSQERSAALGSCFAFAFPAHARIAGSSAWMEAPGQGRASAAFGAVQP